LGYLVKSALFFSEMTTVVHAASSSNIAFSTAVIQNKLDIIARYVEEDPSLINQPLSINNLTLSPLAFAVVGDVRRVFTYLLSHPACDVTASRAVFESLRYHRKAMALEIAASDKWDPNYQLAETEDTALHVACTFQCPDVNFIKALCKRPDVDVTLRNSKNLTPLCLVCRHSRGVEGRIAAVTLLKRGAQRTEALETTKNIQIREVLCLGGDCSRMPLTIPADILAELDAVTDLSKLPDVTDRVMAATMPRSETSSPKTFTKTSKNDSAKKLSREQLEKSVEHLSQIIAPKSVVASSNTPQKEKKVLGPSEIEEVNTRLHDQCRGITLDRMIAMQARVTPEPKVWMKMTLDESKESCTRLSEMGVVKHMEVREKFMKKYVEDAPLMPKPEAKLSKVLLEASAKRLCNESIEKSKKEYEQLFAQYASKDKGRFGGGTKLTRKQCKELSERLLTAGKH